MIGAVLVLLSACEPSELPAPEPEPGEPEVEAGTEPHPTKLNAVPRAEGLASLDPEAVLLIEESATALELDVDRPELWTQLGMVYQAYRRFELARTCYEQRLLRADDDARTHHYLARVCEQLGRTDEAIRHTEASLELAPGYVPAHWRLGLLHLAQGEIGRAESAMEAALGLAPFDAASVVGLARVRLQQDRNDEAVELLETHLERLPGDANARYLLGTAYRKAGRMEEAARALAAGTGGDPVQDDPWMGELYSLRRGYRRQFLDAVDVLGAGEVDRAIELLEALHEREPEDTLIHLSLHRAYRMKGEPDRALSLLVEAERIDPLQDMVHFHLAGAYLDKARAGGDPPDPELLDEALRSAETTCELSPTFANAHGMRGDVLAEKGLAAESTEAWLRAARLERSSVMWNDKAARALCREGRWDEAVPLLRQLDVLRPETPNILYLLGLALAKSGLGKEARIELRRALAAAPDDPRIRQALSELETEGGDG